MDQELNDIAIQLVSMKSGLEGRNNRLEVSQSLNTNSGLNEVRPRRPEQFARRRRPRQAQPRLNEVRPRRPEQ